MKAQTIIIIISYPLLVAGVLEYNSATVCHMMWLKEFGKKDDKKIMMIMMIRFIIISIF